MARILITGSRSFKDYQWVEECLETMIDKENDIVVHGDCETGVDHYASVWCSDNDVTQERHPAQWSVYGKAAGPRRNQEMVDLGADVCLAFPLLGSSKGTWDCMKRAKEAGIDVINVGERYSG